MRLTVAELVLIRQALRMAASRQETIAKSPRTRSWLAYERRGNAMRALADKLANLDADEIVA